MPPRKPKLTALRTVLRVIAVMLAVLVFAACWLFDTGALFHVVMRQITEHRLAATLASVALAVGIFVPRVWPRKPAKRRKVSPRGGKNGKKM